mgnify:CR=1 FL=1
MRQSFMKFNEVMVMKGYADKTIRSYSDALRALSRFYGKAPHLISSKEIYLYLLHLTESRNLSASSCNLALAAFRFFYKYVKGVDPDDLKCFFKKRAKRLPTLLNREEIKRLLMVTANLKHRTLLMTAYASGARSSELSLLKVTDIDSQQMTLRINEGKGKKDRFTVLPKSLLHQLKDYYRYYHPRSWLFYGSSVTVPLSKGSLYRIFVNSKHKAGIQKPGGLHLLRHSFATHMLEQGVDLKQLQSLMGHSCLSTTSLYLHLSTRHLKRLASPLDEICQTSPSLLPPEVR